MRKLVIAFMVLCLLALPGLAFAKKGPITVSSKEFTVQVLLGKMAKIILEENGFEVNDKTALGGTFINRKALTAGNVDMYWEYNGTALVAFYKKPPMSDPEKCYQWVKEEDKKKYNLIWLDPTWLHNDTYALALRKNDAKRLGMRTLSDLAKYGRENPEWLSLSTDHEFYVRPDGYPALAKTYGFEFPKEKVSIMDMGLCARALDLKQVNVGMVFATFPQIVKYDLVVLEDDKHFFPVYNVAPVVRGEVLEKYPEIASILNQISPLLTDAILTRLNYRVDILDEEPEKVARDFLTAMGIVKKK